MHRYHVGGVLLRSDLPLPSLAPAQPSTPAPSSSPGSASTAPAASSAPSAAVAPSVPGGAPIHLIASAAPFDEPERWLYTERFEETWEPWRAVGLSGSRYLVRLFGHADFLLDRDERSARVFVPAEATPAVVEPLFLEQALPLFWSLLGRTCLHASAVAWGEGEGARAVAFAGRSRSGKSTLASSLATSGLLADDCLVIDVAQEHVLAHPGHRAVRLLADSAAALFASPTAGDPSPDGGKRRLDLRGSTRALPLARLYLLEACEANEPPRISMLRPRDAVAQLAASLFRIDPEDRSRLAEELALLDRIAARTVVAKLSVPRRFAALPEVRAAIADDLARV